MTVPRSLSPLPHRETQIADRARSISRVKLVANAHGLHEVITGVPAPGTGSRLYVAHDHCYRGIALPRNAQYSYDQGKNVSKLSWSNNTATDWSSPVEGTTGQSISYVVSSSTRNDVAGLHTFRVYATPNIDSDNTAVSTNPCYLVADMLIVSDYDCSLRFYCVERNEVSATVAVSAVALPAPPVERTAYLPCIGDTVNTYIVEQLCGTVPNTVSIYQLLIGETRSFSQPVSAGSLLYASATRP